MKLHAGKRTSAVIEHRTSHGPVLAEACEWINGEGMTLSLSVPGQATRHIDVTTEEWDMLVLAVQAARLEGP